MNYFYEAIDATGKTILGKMDANDAVEVQQRLMQQGFRPQSIAPNVGENITIVQRRTLMNPNAPVAASVPAQTYSPAMTQGGSIVSQTLGGMQQSAGVMSQSLTANPVGRTGTGGITLAGTAARTATKANRTKAVTTYTPAGTPAPANLSKLGGATTRDLMFFFQQLASLVKSGMTIYSALDNLGPRTPNKNLSQTAAEMKEQARNGGRISDVMAQYPRIYPDHIVGMVRAGELGGFLEIALSEIALNYEQNIALYRGSWIPKLMAVQAFFILPFIIPLFTTFFNAGLDFSAFVSMYLKQVFFIYLPISLALFFGVKWGARRLQLPELRRFRDNLSLKMPPFGDLQRQAAIAAFVRMLRKLYHAGVAPIAAWEGAMNTASNVIIRERLATSYQLMEQGATLPDAFAATGLFTNSIEQLIVTGHQSGEVVESLDKVADYYQDSIDEASGKSKFRMLRFGILAMLIFGGAAVCWMAYSYFHGIFHFVDANFGE